MKVILVLALVIAGVWVWNHHTATDDSFCVTAPQHVCVEHRPTTTRRI